jgi:roadblock/LC7 domain-containing protein
MIDASAFTDEQLLEIEGTIVAGRFDEACEIVQEYTDCTEDEAREYCQGVVDFLMDPAEAARVHPMLKPRELAQIDEQIMNGQFIQAIMILKETTGIGLKHAKEIVEARAKELAARYPFPELAPQLPADGCGTRAALLLIVPGVLLAKIILGF